MPSEQQVEAAELAVDAFELGFIFALHTYNCESSRAIVRCLGSDIYEPWSLPTWPTHGLLSRDEGLVEVKAAIREAVRTRARAALEAAELAVPEGWKLVPVEPTEAMYHSALRITRDPGYGHAHDAIGGSVYRAMLAAAPQPASKEG